MRTAWQNRLVWVLGAVVLVGAVLALWQSTQAQLEVPPAPNDMVAMQPGQPLPPPPGPGVPPGQPFPGQPPVGQPLPGIGERLALGQVAVAANSEYVYVVRGNMLYQFSAKTLELVKSAELPRPQIRRPAATEGQPQTQPRLRRRLQEQGQPPVGQP